MPGDPREDTLDLVARAQAGDRSAIEELFERCNKRIVELVARRSGVPFRHLLDHSDVVNEGLMRVLENLSEFESRSEPSFWGWVSTVVGNRLKDLLKALHAEKRGGGHVKPMADLGSDVRPSRLRGSGDPVSKPLRDDEDRTILEQAFSGLSQKHRDVIVDRELCRMGYDEIAVLRDYKNEDSARAAFSHAMGALMEVTTHLREEDSHGA